MDEHVDYLEVTTDDGRVLEVLTGGDPDGLAWLYHSGSPSAAVPFARFEDAARRQGLRMITYSRPGYGGSSPYSWEDGAPRVVDDVADSMTILEQLGVEEFVTLGWSGGGPRALACGALLPDRCLAVATLAGVGPKDGQGLDWFAGMAPENRAEYAAAVQGPDAYAAYLTEDFLPILQTPLAELVGAMGGLLTPVDAAAFTDDLGDYLARSLQRAGAQGVRGVRDDGLVATAPWGFDLQSTRVPVGVWQGRQDAMVPFAHGEWLAAHVPGAEPHLFDEDGHISLAVRIEEILADLKVLAGR
ncbi:alpha/beta fold hydrolase [Nocardioides panaciterrulae]|uniref:Pimeloyl-ACP methyl ester carboxylesterase n=1 Tax=Nocardioides panaciterrulae TaxID=661492 RepID=A0A7Y9E8Q8_9ACTN|nr:alpha/beta fold hydrolase [Nocardioides panaciterrulae]NYD43273.1 pimeloyl-ACP methyl ester carboxylesterase [Nocardioides panaciterrulae]